MNHENYYCTRLFQRKRKRQPARQAIKAGFISIFPQAECICLPIADGGEGTVEAMVEATEGKMVMLPVMGPMGDFVGAFYGLSGDGQTAFIEMAAASGLMLVPPGNATPAGYQLRYRRADSPRAGHRRSSHYSRHWQRRTVDGGMGMAQALGARFVDERGERWPRRRSVRTAGQR